MFIIIFNTLSVILYYKLNVNITPKCEHNSEMWIYNSEMWLYITPKCKCEYIKPKCEFIAPKCEYI